MCTVYTYASFQNIFVTRKTSTAQSLESAKFVLSIVNERHQCKNELNWTDIRKIGRIYFVTLRKPYRN